MKGLELIKTRTADGVLVYYWGLDHRYDDDSDGKYLVSVNYDSDKDAIKALEENNIEWESL